MSSRTFDQVGEDFDSVGFVRVIAQRLVEQCAIAEGSYVLDVACGTGAALLAALPLAGQRGFGVGVDLSPGMVAGAARKLARVPRSAVAVMDAEGLGFLAGSFDVAVCASAIYMFDDRAAVISEMARLLRSGGALGVSDFGAEDARWGWYDALLRELSPSFPHVSGGHLGRDGLAELLARTGEVRVTVERLDVVYADFEMWWQAQWTYRGRQYLDAMSGPTLEAYRRRACAAVEEVREDDGRLHWRPEVVYAVATVSP